MLPSPRPVRPTTRLVDGLVRAYAPAADDMGVLSPAVACRPAAGDEVVDHTVTTDLRHAYCTTPDAVVCVAAADGTVVHHASPADGRIDLDRYPWVDRCLVDLSPDGHRFLTVDHAQTDLAVHAFPGGEVVFTLTVDDFGNDPDTVFLEWSGGYLTPDTLVVTLVGETEDEQDRHRHYHVDARSGRVLGESDARTTDPDDLRPPGDGSWLTTDPSGHPVRRTATP